MNPEKDTEADEGQRIYADFIESLIPGARQTPLNFAFELFGEAAVAFDARAHAASALLCRAAIEAAFYAFLTRVKVGEQPLTVWAVGPPRKLDGTYRIPGWGELLDGITKEGILTPEQLKAVGRVRKDGNFIAHLASIFDEVVSREVGWSRDLRSWITEEEARKDLHNTAAVLRVLAEALYLQPPKEEAYGVRRVADKKWSEEG